MWYHSLFMLLFIIAPVYTQQGVCCVGSTCISAASALSCNGNSGGSYIPSNTCQACSMRTSTNLSSYATILNNNLNTAGSVRLYGNFAIAGQGISGSDIIVYGRTDMSNSASSSVINEAISLIDKIDSLTVWTYTSGTIAGTRFTPGFYYIEGQAQITSNIVFDGPGVYVIKILNNMIWSSGVKVTLVNGAKACDIYWLIGQGVNLSSNIIYGHLIGKTNMNLGQSVVYGTVAAPRDSIWLGSMSIYSCRASGLSVGGSVFDVTMIKPSLVPSCRSRLSNTQCITFWSVYNPNSYRIDTKSIISWSCQYNSTIWPGSNDNFASCLTDCNTESVAFLSVNGVNETLRGNSSLTCYGSCKVGNCTLSLPSQCPPAYFGGVSSSCPLAPSLNTSNTTTSQSNTTLHQNQTISNNTSLNTNQTWLNNNTWLNTTLIPINQTLFNNTPISNSTIIANYTIPSNHSAYSNQTLANSTIITTNQTQFNNTHTNGTIPDKPKPSANSSDDGSWHICI